MKKTSSIVIAATICVLILSLGLYLGNKNGRKIGNKETEDRLSPIVNSVFPKPADEITNLTGVIKEIYGAQISFEIADPADYLPHPDGTPQKKQIRTASISKSTQIVSISFDKQGNPKTTPLKISDLKIGDTITVRSDQNLREAKKFDASQIELLKY